MPRGFWARVGRCMWPDFPVTKARPDEPTAPLPLLPVGPACNCCSLRRVCWRSALASALPLSTSSMANSRRLSSRLVPSTMLHIASISLSSLIPCETMELLRPTEWCIVRVRRWRRASCRHRGTNEMQAGESEGKVDSDGDGEDDGDGIGDTVAVSVTMTATARMTVRVTARLTNPQV